MTVVRVLWLLMVGLVCCTHMVGCRAVGSALGERDAELRTGQWWAGPLPALTPLKPQDRVAWIQYRNITQEPYELQAQIRQGLEAQGYRLVDDPDLARFHVFYTLRFFGENPQGDEGRGVATGLGAITGGATGVAIAHAAGGGLAGGIGAGVGGALVGGLAGRAISNAARPIEYNLIMDINIAERKKGLVRREVVSDQRDRQVSATGASTGRGGVVGGGRDTRQNTRQTTEEEDNMFWQENRLVLWARQFSLRPEEAKPVLERAMVGSLPKVLP